MSAPNIYRGSVSRSGCFVDPGLRKQPKLLWKHSMAPSYASYSHVVTDERVVCVCSTRTCFALDRTTGALQWTLDGPSSWLAGSPLVHDGAVWLPLGGLLDDGSRGGRMLVCDAATGAVRRTIGAELVTQSPLILDGMLVSGALDGTVVAIDSATDELRWRSEVVGEVFQATLAEHDGRVFGTAAAQGGKDGVLFALDVASGAVRWREPLGNVDHVTVIAERGAVWCANDRRVDARDARTGAELWSVELKCQLAAIAALDAGTLYVADNWCSLQALDARTGARRWEHSGALARNGLTVAGDTLYVCADQKLVALDTATGAELWAISTRGKGGDARDVVPRGSALYVTCANQIMAFGR